MAALSQQKFDISDLPHGLPGREQLRQFAASMLPQSERNGMELCFLTIALNANPQIARGRGSAMEAAGNRILGCIRAGDFLAVSGPAEFVVILAAGCKQLAASHVAERIQQAIEKPLNVTGQAIRMTCQVGISATRDDVLDVDRILANSAAALRQCNATGEKSIRHFSQTTQAEIDHHIFVTRELDGALCDGTIVPWFQPQVSLATGELTGFEALVRWDHPEKGILNPAAFLDVAEQSGQIEKIGEAVLSASILAIRDWHQGGFNVPRVAVNLSSSQLNNPCLAELIKWELDRHSVAPHHLTIEILESVLGGADSGVIARNLRSLKAIGVQVDLDDFGTGNASLINIRRFGVHRIKIDRAFIKGIDQDLEQQKITSAIITMANALGVEVLAEGVETFGEERFLQHIGCQYIQGFALARPMPFQDVVPWLKARAAQPMTA